MPAVRTLTFRVALVGGFVAIVLVASLAPLAAAAIRQSVGRCSAFSRPHSPRRSFRQGCGRTLGS